MVSWNLELNVRDKHFETSLIQPAAWKPFNPPDGQKLHPTPSGIIRCGMINNNARVLVQGNEIEYNRVIYSSKQEENQYDNEANRSFCRGTRPYKLHVKFA